MMTLFNQEEVMDIYLYNYGEEKKAEGEALGEAKGEAKGKINTVKSMIKAGLTTFAAVKSSGLYTEQELAAIAAP